MAASLIRTSARTALRSGASAAPRAATSLTFARGKATLPDLSCMLAPPHQCTPRLKIRASFHRLKWITDAVSELHDLTFTYIY
jgi:hypothetical protein